MFLYKKSCLKVCLFSYKNEWNISACIAGDLKTYLLSRRNLVGSLAREAEDVSAEKLTKMALDIAYGLRYIHELKYVHRWLFNSLSK